MEPDTGQLAALSRLFSSTVFHELAKHGRSNLFARLFRQSGLARSKNFDRSVGDGFDAAFSVLKRSGCRDEYIYKAALTHNILLGRHSLKTASMLTEFRVGACKADLVILNGTGTVYEIKSERDSLARLKNQIENYRTVFAKIYIIASESHICSILNNNDTDIGIMCLNSRGQITTRREAVINFSKISPLAIFDSLRSSEARSVLQEFRIGVPDVPNSMLRSRMREQFAQLDPGETHRQMVGVLKRTRNLAPLGALVEKLPRSLQPAALSIQFRSSDHLRLLDAIKTPLHLALSWD